MPKPATQRPTLPSVGRLGLIEPPARADLDRLGWTTDAHVELLWSLSRSPDADVALRTMVRLADALEDGWDELNRALVKDRGLRGRLFGVLGSSLALGDHLVAQPRSWHLLAGRVVRRGEKGTRVAMVVDKAVTKEGATEKVKVVKTKVVFNIAQTEPLQV